MSVISAMPAPPSSDKRWKLVDATIKRHGRAGHSLIECLHTMQECFGYLDEQGLKYVAAALNLPLSKVVWRGDLLPYLHPQAARRAYLRGVHGHGLLHQGHRLVLAALEKKYGVKPGETTQGWQDVRPHRSLHRILRTGARGGL